MTTRIDRVWPDPAEQLTDDELVERADRPVLRVNFVSSIDGAATHDGLSGGLSGPADKRLFELLRRTCDLVLVGAGTVRAEGYGGLRVSDASARWREERGLTPHPVFAIVSGRLALDVASPVFTEAPVRPIVITGDRAKPRSSAAFSGDRAKSRSSAAFSGDRAKSRSSAAFREVADVIEAGTEHVDLPAMLAALHERGLTRILCEGGPSLFGSLLAADVVDELHVTIAPRLEGGDARRISAGETPVRTMHLGRILRSGDELMLRYDR